MVWYNILIWTFFAMFRINCFYFSRRYQFYRAINSNWLFYWSNTWFFFTNVIWLNIKVAIAIITYVIAMTDTRNWLNFASKLKFLVCFNMEPNVGKTWSLCNIIFVTLTCFYFANFFGEEKFSALPSRNKVADKNLALWTSFF